MEMQSVCVTKTGGFVDATNVARPSCQRLFVFTDPTALIFIGLLNRLVHIQPSHKLADARFSHRLVLRITAEWIFSFPFVTKSKPVCGIHVTFTVALHIIVSGLYLFHFSECQRENFVTVPYNFFNSLY